MYDALIDSTTRQSRISVARETFQYVSILDTLKRILSDPSVRSKVENGHINNENVMRDFCDSHGYREHGLFVTLKSALEINLFFDEFEVVNPLGNKTGVHKTGAFLLCTEESGT